MMLRLSLRNAWAHKLRFLMTTFAVVMFGRGAGGYLMNSGAAAEFRRWNSVLYSPLCLVLCLLAVSVAVAAIRR